MIRNQLVRWVLFGIGFVALILGVIGIFLPILPTTPFVLLAAWCFYRSSPRVHAFIYRQPYLGRVLRDWDQRGAISRKTKIQAISMIVISAVIMWIKVEPIALRVGVTILLVCVSAFIVTRPE